LWHSFGHVQALDSQRALLRKAFDLGITHFDLANNYGPPPGSAEENFGRLLREDFTAYRDELIISTKAGYDMWPGPYGSGGSRKYLLASLDQSLKRMGWTTSISSIRTVSMRIRRWKRPPLRWPRPYRAVKRSMSASPLIQRREPRQW
jgi:aryl-alcohol dehydrogenase-like predicted oxidoreductase